MKIQSGFAAQGIIILVVVVGLIMGIGYFVITRQSHDEEPNIVGMEASLQTIPDGTPETTASAVSEQLAQEVANEINAMETEDANTDLDSSAIEELEGAIDESNL